MTDLSVEYKDLDLWIEQLYDNKQLTETQVKVLCETVIVYYLCFFS